MRTIHFKNGQSKDITQDEFDLIIDWIKNHNGTFLWFKDVKKDEHKLLLNYQEINYID